MIHRLLLRNSKRIFENRSQIAVINQQLKRQISSNEVKSSNQSKFRYIKYLAITLGSTITCSVIYQVYKWIVQVSICPNFDRNQNININNVLVCTALVRNLDKQCSGTNPMKKIGAATGVNFKLISNKSSDDHYSTRVILNDNDIIQRNIFDETYLMDYFETLADLLLKLDEIHRTRLLSNLISYYIFICPECHSSITRQMISSTWYLNQVGLQRHAADISAIESQNKIDG